ncbi:hypothetical protein BKA67DRAFT_660127 [Truncatella angustata]|uniref:Uncharacterized protein n=1 Tax=Truncatella angustata TaxID=152316 RepID=A0A9P8UJU8_9PEZI|nr:uncharacterized protein BKA67DRAFT_660127 [Truncatella angustata]KAH6653532.1 hypothetical protein BKA67DRAFT_660127 [Truncatella angustata]
MASEVGLSDLPEKVPMLNGNVVCCAVTLACPVYGFLDQTQSDHQLQNFRTKETSPGKSSSIANHKFTSVVLATYDKALFAFCNTTANLSNTTDISNCTPDIPDNTTSVRTFFYTRQSRNAPRSCEMVYTQLEIALSIFAAALVALKPLFQNATGHGTSASTGNAKANQAFELPARYASGRSDQGNRYAGSQELILPPK